MLIDIQYGNIKRTVSLDKVNTTIGGDAGDVCFVDIPGLPKSLFTVRQMPGGSYDLKTKSKIYHNGKKISKKSNIAIGDTFIFFDKNREIVRITVRKESPMRVISLPTELVIGKKDICSLKINNGMVSRIHAVITYRDSVAEITDMDSLNGTFVNDRRIKRCALKNRDVISIAECRFLYQNGCLSYEDNPSIEYHFENMPVHSKTYPVVYPSPKLQQPLERIKWDIKTPPNIGSKPEISMFSLIGTPLIMGAVYLGAVWLLPKFTGARFPSYMLFFSLPMMLVGAVAGVVNYKRQVKKYRERFGKKIEKYSAYIKETDKQMALSRENQLKNALASNPPTDSCFDIVNEEKRELWNRTVADYDFLSFRIGLGSVENADQINLPNTELDIEEDKLIEKMKKVVSNYRVIDNMPIMIDLKRHPVIGVYGSEDLNLIQNFIMQLTTFHTCNDLRIVLLTSSKKYGTVSWMRWLPHLFSYDRSYRYIALNANEVKTVLKTAQNEMLGRREKKSETFAGKFDTKLPFYLFVVTEPQYFNNPEIQPLLPAFGTENGAGAILTAEYFEQLPGITNAFVRVGKDGYYYYRKDSVNNKIAFLPDSVSFNIRESFGRAMAPLRIIDNESISLLPSSISFFDGMKIRFPQEWPLQQYWLSAKPDKTMSVPIGISENGDLFYFDIHEKKDGPHGIVAGRSGSGKSEILQDWILSMAMHFSPSDVSFILIDPKKAITQLFKPLPHIAGIIEELDNKHLINKCFNALTAEIGRRQDLFNRAGVQSIFKYIERRKTDPSLEKLSIIFFIIDEYAEFKQLYPEIARDKVDTILRIGRSLGIYAILATQNPSGIVTDSMEANVRFRWCLPVAEESYSVEMLGSGHTEAAFLKNPGRTYIKIGSDEYHLVQSFFTGARFEPDAKEKRTVKVPIAMVKPDGTREKLRESNKTLGLRSYHTEAEIMVEYLNNYVRSNNIPFSRQVWTPIMPAEMYLPDLLSRSFDGYNWPEGNNSLSAVIGMVDDPFMQSQHPLELDFSGDGHHFIYGAPMSGKTTFLQTIIMSLCLLYPPADVNIYGLDFGSWSLGVFKDFPQTGGIANSNEEEKIRKLIVLIQELLKERRAAFSSAGVGNLKIYREVTNDLLPYVVLAVDNLQKILAYDPDLTEFFQTLVSEGANYGIILVATLTGTAGVNYKISDQVKIKIPLQLNDENEYAPILGLKSFALRPMATVGRGLVSINKYPMEFQTALPVKSDSESERTIEIKQAGDVMRRAWHGELPRPIPIMPDIIPSGSIRSNGISLGLRVRDVKPVVFNPSSAHFMLVSGTPGSGKTNMLKVIGAQFKELRSARVVGMNTQDSYSAGDSVYDEYLTEADEIDSYFENLSDELKRRKSTLSVGEEDFDCEVILIDNFRKFYECISDDAAKRLEALIKIGRGLNVFCIIADDASSFAKEYGRTEPFTTIGNGRYRILLGGSFNQHAQFDSDLTFAEKSELLNDFEGFYLDGKTTVKFKCMKGE